jgi:hypothetical protein
MVGRIDATRANPGDPNAKKKEPMISGMMKISWRTNLFSALNSEEVIRREEDYPIHDINANWVSCRVGGDFILGSANPLYPKQADKISAVNPIVPSSP